MADDQQSAALGDAMYAALGMANIWAALVSAGVISKDQAKKAADTMLFQIEQMRGRQGVPTEAVEYARGRTLFLLQRLESLPDNPPR